MLCRNCGAEINDRESWYCKKCGQTITDKYLPETKVGLDNLANYVSIHTQEQINDKKKLKASKVAKIIVIILLILMLTIIPYFFTWYQSHYQDELKTKALTLAGAFNGNFDLIDRKATVSRSQDNEDIYYVKYSKSGFEDYEFLVNIKENTCSLINQPIDKEKINDKILTIIGAYNGTYNLLDRTLTINETKNKNEYEAIFSKNDNDNYVFIVNTDTNSCKLVTPVDSKKNQQTALTSTNTFKPYKVKVICKYLNVRNTPNLSDKNIVYALKQNNICIIVDETTVNGIKFGKLKNGKGYISLDEAYVSKI